MKIPLGDILRAFLPWRWLRALKGISISKGDTTILLNDQDRSVNRQNPEPFAKPHEPGR